MRHNESVAAKIVLTRQLHLNCKDKKKIKMLFYFRIPAGRLCSRLALLVQFILTVYFGFFFISCRICFSWGNITVYSLPVSTLCRCQSTERVEGQRHIRETHNQGSVMQKIILMSLFHDFFLYFIFKQQFQALHKKIWTTTACALLSITYQIQPMTTYPITRF